MNTQKTSQIDKFGLILLLLFIASAIYSTTNHFLSFMIPSGDTYNHVVLQSRFTYMVYSVFQYIIYIGASIWLYKEAKTNNNKPWLWALLGLFGGLIAVVLWYLKKIHSLLSAQETK